MVDIEGKDLPKENQSSHLWKLYKQEKDIPTENLNVSNGLQQTVFPRFNTIIERSRITPECNGLTKELTTISLSKMRLNSSPLGQPRSVWSPSTLSKDNSKMPMIERYQSSKLTLIAKNGQQICQTRLWIIALAASLCVLCSLAIALPIGLVYGTATYKTITIIDATVSTNSTTSITATTVTVGATSTTAPITAWIPSNYNDSCSNTCINVSTVTPSTLLASWPFEQNVNDVSGNSYNGQTVNGPTFTTGYIGESILLQNNLSQYVNAPYINLVNRSFTVETWFYLNSLSPSHDLDILGECENISTARCLHYVVRSNKLYFAFYTDDLAGVTNLTTNVWYHAAFVYDVSLLTKYLYLNGIFESVSTGVAYRGAFGNVSIGSSAIFTSISYWNGLLDQLTITNRAKTACEILNDASLIAYFSFDNTFNDNGPNSMSVTYNQQGNSGLSWITGQVNQALYFNSSSSYFESCGYIALGQNQAYSIAMWINPSSTNGTLFHLSSTSTGSGLWCLPMIGLSSNGSIVVQTWNGAVVSIIGPILPINTWAHVVQTWSSINGLRFYLNGGLYNSIPVSTFSSSLLSMCILLSTSGFGTNCATGQISMGTYSGAIDEVYIYNRELNASEVCPLAHP